MLSDEMPRCPGTYTLLIHVACPLSVRVGRLGCHAFPPGLYTYTGSALGTTGVTLRTRLARHLTDRKTAHWHIDYLLTSPSVHVVAVVYVAHPGTLECAIVQNSRSCTHGRVVVDRFGSSDCRSGCHAHLHYCGDVALLTLVRLVYATYQRCVASSSASVQVRMLSAPTERALPHPKRDAADTRAAPAGERHSSKTPPASRRSLTTSCPTARRQRDANRRGRHSFVARDDEA